MSTQEFTEPAAAAFPAQARAVADEQLDRHCIDVTPLASWHPEITPGEPFRVPAQWIVPHAGDFWGTPKHVIENIDPTYGDYGCLATYALTPANDHLARHWVYTARVGQEGVWNEEDTGHTVHQRYLGIYRVWGLKPNDWKTGTLGFSPAGALSPIDGSCQR